MVKTAEEAFAQVHIAISNVAARRHRAFLEMNLDDWNATINTNLNSAFYLAQAVLPTMQAAKWGRLLIGTLALCTDGVATLAVLLGEGLSLLYASLRLAEPSRLYS